MQVMAYSDQELIQNYLNGDDRSFETLLNRHKTKIYTSIYLFTRDSEAAEDIFQEVFIKIIDTLRKGNYNHEGKFLQWAMRIAYNMCVDQFRRSKRNAHVSTGEAFDVFSIIPSHDDNMEQYMIKEQGTNHIKSLVDQLPDEQREVVILRHYADMSFKEISMLTRVSINTALGRMRYALINLRRMMEETNKQFSLVK
ncbi:MAG: sigma-70 family RNA polymerase sigma factor [Saprospiraceae bacterium]|jgi:RNA polymerase sigma-70 factor (ECF subfamily)|nr:sigma-70 family RNA polymerase sigma factor [Saprospiraceae bacterium]